MTTPSANAGGVGGGTNIGTATGFIDLNINGAISSINRLKNQISGMVSNSAAFFTNTGAQISSFGSGLTTAMLPVAAGFGAGINAASNFEASLAEIQARTGLTEDAMESVRQKALQLGAGTSFSAQQAADAYLQLLTSGSSDAQAKQQIDTVLRGAEAAGSDLAFTADMLTDVMSQFNIEAEHSEAVMSDLINATGSSSATLESLSQGFANVGTIAQGFGLSVGETAAALAVLDEKGIKGAEGGTQLKTILSELGKPGPRKELERLGVAFADGQGNIRDFDAILKDINVAMSGMSEVEKRETIMELAGAYGQAGLSALLMEDGISSMQATMEEQTNFIEIAKKRTEGFRGQITSLKGSIETLLISAFTPFIESLTPYVTRMVNIVNSVRAWTEANKELTQRILKGLAVLIALGPTLFGVGKAFQVVGFLIGALTSPLQILLLAGTAFVAAWTTDFMGLQTRLQPVFDGISRIIRFFISDIQNFGLKEAFLGIFGQGSVSETMESSLEGALVTMGFARDRAITIVDGIWNVISGIGKAFSTVFTVIRAGFALFRGNDFRGAGILQNLGLDPIQAMAMASRIRDVIDFVRNVISGFASFVTGTLLPIVTAGFGGSFQIISTIFTSLASAWTNQLEPAFQRFQLRMAMLSVSGISLKDTIINIIGRIADFASAFFNVAIPAVASLVVWFLDSLPGAIQATVNFYNNRLKPMFDAMSGFITNTVLPKLQEFAAWFGETGWGNAVSSARLIYDTVLLPMWNAIRDAVDNTVLPALGRLWTWFTTGGLMEIGTTIANFLSLSWDVFVLALQVLWDTVSSAFQSLKDWFVSGGMQDIGTAITNFLSATWDVFKNALAGAWDFVSAGIDRLKNGLSTAFNWIKDNVIQPVIDTVQRLLDLWNEAGNIRSSASNDINNMRDAISEGGARGAVNQGLANIKSFFGAVRGSFATGTDFVPQTGLYELHRGERVVTADDNRAGNFGKQVTIQAVHIHADTYEGGQRAAEGFDDRLMQLVRTNG